MRCGAVSPGFLSLRGRVIDSRLVATAMQPAPDAPAGLRFGIFEADLQTGELKKRGVRVRLQEQPFQVLAALLARPGELITREELQRQVWAADTFVDFDHGLNKAINKIREALGDSAENPRFVETVARRGYRFIADVAVVDSDSVPPLAGAASAGDPLSLIPAPVDSASGMSTRNAPALRRALTVAGATLAL